MPGTGAGYGAGAGAGPGAGAGRSARGAAPSGPGELLALADAARAGLTRVKARCVALAGALEDLEARAAPLAERDGQARADVAGAAAELQARAVEREEAHCTELAQIRERRAKLQLGAATTPSSLPFASAAAAGDSIQAGEGQVAAAAEELRRALQVGGRPAGGGGGGPRAGGAGRGLQDVRLEFKLDRNFNVKDVWEASEDSDGG